MTRDDEDEDEVEVERATRRRAATLRDDDAPTAARIRTRQSVTPGAIFMVAVSASASTTSEPSLRARGGARPRASARASVATRAMSREEWFKDDDRGVILYDGVCNLCNGAVNFALEYDAEPSRGSVRFAALQGETGRAMLVNAGRDADDISSIVFVEGAAPSESYVKSEAILRIARRMRAPFPQLSALGSLVPRAIGDFVYDAVADNRYSLLGKRDACRFGDDENDERFLR